MSEPAVRRGRPRGTSARELEVIALRLFAEQGFDETTVEQIATTAGVSGRAFFRYFSSKADVLWHDFDREVTALRAALAATPPELDVLDAIRHAVVSVNRYTASDVPELRARVNLIATVPALQATQHYDAWERAVIEFAATRLGERAQALRPVAIGRATLAVCRAAYEQWVVRGDADLTVYLDEALVLLSHRFDL